MTALRDQTARDRIVDDLDASLFVEAGAGSGKTRALVERVVALVAAGVEVREIAAITFTEKAAAELRDRIRTQLIKQANDPAQEHGLRDSFRAAVEQVDAAAISTLHAFAQRILTEHPIEAGLPPNVEVLDEVASQIGFADRWARFRERMLDNEDLERCLLLAFAAGIRLDDLRHLATVFDDNWDLVGEPQRLPWPRTDPPACDAERFAARIEALLARRAECSHDGDRLYRHLEEKIAPYLLRLRDAPDEFEQLRLLKSDRPSFRVGCGRKGNWDDVASVRQDLAGIGDEMTVHADEVALASLHRVAREVADFTLEAAEQRRTSGRLEFHDLLVLSRRLLRGPDGVAVRGALRRRYRRLLLDEFQDTDPIQIDLAVLIASDDPGAASRNWWEIEVERGRLFFVGDPKQSIYRFRRADIDLFLRARQVFGEAPIELTTNFRACPPLIDWVNAVFARLITYEPGSQPAYLPLDAAPARQAPPDGIPVVVLGRSEHVDDPDADELRRREAEDVAVAVQVALTWHVRERDGGGQTWRAAQLGDVTILLPARTSLPALERALDARDIPYRAETSSLVYSTREVRDLLMTVRALADPTDQLALVAALRSPVFGCGDDDLFTYKVRHGGAFSFRWRPAGVPDDHPVAEALTYLADVHSELAWLSPSELLDRIARDRRLFELGYAQGRPRDLWRRLRFVIDQARAWSEAEGGTLREYVDWARMQASESARVAETILPETDDDSVRIMTIHAAKGLEFPITIVSGMTTQSQRRGQRVEVKFPPHGPVAVKVGSEIVTPEFKAFRPIDEQMDHHERLRLLYVACTRAQDHLVVSLHRKARTNPQTDPGRCTNAELLAQACDGAPHAVELPTSERGALAATPARIPQEPLPPLDQWEAERADKLAASAVRRNLAATDVSRLTLDVDRDDEVAAGVAKDPRDLELPPWQKGRYGSAIGRAVHGVLQTIDLATGAGLHDAAAAQAAAEGVIGREAAIVQLARAALDAEVVNEALGYPRWRETYVAARLGERTLEGYIDLLFRAEDGLVVVDYKTASAAADIDQRMGEYRAQGGSYALAVEGATGERVSRVVFVFLTSQGPIERQLDDVAGAKAIVRRAVLASGGVTPGDAARAG